MRLANNENQFFRAFNPSVVAFNSEEKHRIWLNLKNNSGQFSQILVGYMNEATNDYDFGIDVLAFGNQGSTLYSLDHENKYTIQAKSLPFEDSEIFPLGIKIVEPGNYHIELNNVDGLFNEKQNIYLKDKKLNIIHDLKKKSYSFVYEVDTYDRRFEIIFKNEALSNNLEKFSNITIHQSENLVHIKLNDDKIEQIEIYDLLGRSIFYKTKINETALSFSVQGIRNQVLVVKITTKNKGLTTTKINTK